MTPTFRPWVGKDYGRSSRWGLSLMLIGYSHYEEFKDVEPERYTQYVVGRHVSGINDRSRYWTKCARTFGGDSGRGAFWDSLVFYNYVQGFVGDGPRINPTTSQIQASWAPFRAVAEQYRPDLMIVTHKGLWTDTLVPRIGLVQELSLHDDRTTQFAILDAASPGTGVISYINHPSSGGYKYATWRPVVAALLTKARSLAH